MKFRFNYQKANAFCDDNNLSRGTMSFLSELMDQLSYTMKDVGVSMNNHRVNNNNGNIRLVTSLCGMALYPDVGIRNGAGSYTTEKGRKTRVHPSSVNFKASVVSKKSKVQDVMSIMGYQVCI